jgi:hypothetical protein
MTFSSIGQVGKNRFGLFEYSREFANDANDEQRQTA